MSREIDDTDWVHKCIAEDYLKPGDLCLSQDLPHHDRLTPDSSPSFSDSHVVVMEIECC